MRRILVTTNLAEPPEAYFASAAEVARQLGAEPILFHVFDLAAYLSAWRRTGIELDDYNDRLKERLRRRAASGGFVGPVRVELGTGRPVPDEIVASSGRLRADLIVMGHVGDHPAGVSYSGGVVEKVLHGARCPIVIVPLAPSPEFAHASGPTAVPDTVTDHRGK